MWLRTGAISHIAVAQDAYCEGFKPNFNMYFIIFHKPKNIFTSKLYRAIHLFPRGPGGGKQWILFYVIQNIHQAGI